MHIFLLAAVPEVLMGVLVLFLLKRTRKCSLMAILLALLPSSFLAQSVPAPQIGLSGNVGIIGSPILNSGTYQMPSDANVTFSNSNVNTSAFSIKITSAVSLTATRSLIYPAGRFTLNVCNATTGAQSIVIIGPSGTGVTIANGVCETVWNDGTNYVQVGASGGSSSTTLTGDVTGTGTGTVATTLASVNSSSGSCGDTSHSCQVTTNAKGLVTSQTPVLISSGTSATIKYMSLYCSAYQNSDGNAGGGTDGTACINSLFAASTPSNPVTVWQDKGFTLVGSSGVGMQCPVGGNCTLAGNGGGIAKLQITNCSISGGVAIFTTASNTLAAGDVATLDRLTHCHSITNTTVTVLSAGLSSTQFEVAASGSVASGAETGTLDKVYGTGFFLASGANIDAFANGRYLSGSSCSIDPATAGNPPGQGSNITLENFVLNGNANGQSNYCFGIHIANINGFRMENVVIYNSSHFSLTLDNVSDWVVHASTFSSSTDANGQNTDGIHVNGPSSKGRDSDNNFQTGDDSLAYNAREGYCGPITDMVSTNDTFDSANIVRAYTAGILVCPSNSLVPTVNGLTMSNYSGKTYGGILNLGLGQGSPNDGNYQYALQNIKLSDSTIEFLGTNTSPAITVHDNVSDLDVSNVTVIGMAASNLVSLYHAGQPNIWGNFNFNNIKIISNSHGNTFAQLISNENSAPTLDSVTLDGFSIQGQGVTPGTISNLLETGQPFASPVKYVQATNIDQTYVSGFLDPGSTTYATKSIYANNGIINTGPVVSGIYLPTTLVTSSTAFSSTYGLSERFFAYGSGTFTLTLPAINQNTPGITKCVQNYANTGPSLLLQTATSGSPAQVINDINGSASAVGGYIKSSGAPGDSICVVSAYGANGHGNWQVVEQHGNWQLDGSGVISGSYLPLTGGTLSGTLYPTVIDMGTAYGTANGQSWKLYNDGSTNLDNIQLQSSKFEILMDNAAGTKILFGHANYSRSSITTDATIDQSGNFVAVGGVTGAAFNPSSTQTVITCSTSGTVVASEPFQGFSYKKVIAYSNACSGTFNYSFPVTFSLVPSAQSSTGGLTSITATTSSISGTGTAASGFIIFEGY